MRTSSLIGNCFSAAFFLLTVVSSVPLTLTAQVYEVEGTVSHEYIGVAVDPRDREKTIKISDKQKPPQRKYPLQFLWVTNTTLHFAISVDGCRWQMRLQDGSQLSYDGVYSYWSRPQEFISSTQSVSAPLGLISKGVIPHVHAIPAAGSLWLSYASACYFSSNPDTAEPVIDRIISGADYDYHNALKQKVQFSLNSSGPLLPTYAVYFDDGVLRDPAGRGGAPPKPRNPPYNQGFTNTIFRVLETRTIGTNTLPWNAVLEVYVPKSKSFGAPRDGRTADELLTLQRFTILATNMKTTLSSTSFVAALHGKTSIEDLRFLSTVNEGIAYLSDSWRPEEQIIGTPPYRAALAVKRRMDTSGMGRGSPATAMILFAGIAIVPFLFGWRAYKEKRQRAAAIAS